MFAYAMLVVRYSLHFSSLLSGFSSSSANEICSKALLSTYFALPVYNDTDTHIYYKMHSALYSSKTTTTPRYRYKKFQNKEKTIKNDLIQLPALFDLYLWHLYIFQHKFWMCVCVCMNQLEWSFICEGVRIRLTFCGRRKNNFDIH